MKSASETQTHNVVKMTISCNRRYSKPKPDRGLVYEAASEDEIGDVDTVNAFATLRLADDDLVPEVVAGIMRLEPEISAEKNGLLYPLSRSNATAKTGTWFVSSDHLHEITPEQRLDYVYDLVEKHIWQIKELYHNIKISFSLLAISGTSINLSLVAKIPNIGHVEIEYDQVS